MKKIETTNISGTQDAPFIKDTFDHYNESIANTTSEIIKGIQGSYTTNDIIVLYGCNVTASIPGTSSITAGAVYYNGEVYQVDANASLVTSGLQTLVWGIVTTYRAVDPVEWSDGVTRNLHQIDKFALSAGLSGSGLANYNATTVKRLFPTSGFLMQYSSAAGPVSFSTPAATVLTVTPSTTKSTSKLKVTFSGHVLNGIAANQGISLSIKRNGTLVADTVITAIASVNEGFCFVWPMSYTAGDVITATAECTNLQNLYNIALICEAIDMA